MHLTEEQRKIVFHPLQWNEIVKVVAFAGTGKTTTLIHFARARSTVRFLYLAFNKSVQQEASHKFPKNVHCKTAHSLAWSGFGRRFQHKLVGQIRANTIMNVMNLPNYEQAKFVLETIQNFLISADPRIVRHHVPVTVHGFYEPEQEPDFIQLAKECWILMSDPRNTEVPITHDGYLKLYQLSKPQLSYDCILLDEAQDTNPVIADIVFIQECAKVLVGDPHQSIYQFRGAVDIMNKITADTIGRLTTSFRFGNGIANMANLLLQHTKGEHYELHGGSPVHGKIGKILHHHTLIARTNASLFDEAIKLLPRYSIGFVGGIQGYGMDRILDTYHLWRGEKEAIQDRYLRGFNSFLTMKLYAENVEDWELASRCRIVEKYEHDIPQLLQQIKKKTVPLEEAQIVLTTAHKAKGLEFPCVRLANDFTPLVKEGQLLSEECPQAEINLLYVALTRAQKQLELNTQLQDFLQLLADQQPKRK